MAEVKEEHKPTEEQQAVVEAARRKSGESVMANAYAGCAKSYTLKLAAREIKVPGLGLAFNKKIAGELQGQLPSNFSVKTMNGLGLAAWCRANPGMSLKAPDTRKLGRLVSQEAKSRKLDLSTEQWEGARMLVNQAMLAGLTPGDQGMPMLPDTVESWQGLADDLLIGKDDFDLLYELAHSVLEESIALGKVGVLSFDDQIYLSAFLGGKFPKFPVIIADEIQDLSPSNHRMIELALRSDGRIIGAGDEKQCHPLGTKIKMSGGGDKLIENLNVGDRVVSFNRKMGFTGLNNQGSIVTDVKRFEAPKQLVRISTDEEEFSHDCTLNHRCLVKLEDKAGYSVYLMQKGDYFRIGNAQNVYQRGEFNSFGPAMRARQEGADKLWILENCQTKDEALILEKVIWTRFGLPDLIFRCSGKASSTQVHLDEAWFQIGANVQRALICLKAFNRLYEFPLWKKGEPVHIGDKKAIIEACNLVSGLFSVKVFNGSERGKWLKAWTETISCNDEVIGITVQSNGYGQNLYLANGIVTHNSIYGFRGASYDSVQRIRALRAQWIDTPLRTTFRCPKVVVTRQQNHAPGFRAFEANKPGEYIRLPRFSEEDMLPGWGPTRVKNLLNEKNSLAIICRNNGPILSLAFKLLREGIGVSMVGRDLGKGLITLSRKLIPEDFSSVETCAGLIQDWQDKECSLALANGNEEKVGGIVDRAECLKAVLSSAGVSNAGQLRDALTHLFSAQNAKVQMGSIHSVKGLEFDAVLHLDPWRLPSKWARAAAKAGDSRALVQEWNLGYVAETRTRDLLLTGNLEDFNSEN